MKELADIGMILPALLHRSVNGLFPYNSIILFKEQGKTQDKNMDNLEDDDFFYAYKQNFNEICYKHLDTTSYTFYTWHCITSSNYSHCY